MGEIDGVRHIRPTSRVVGYAAPMCLVVETPWLEAEPHMREQTREYPLEIVREFDPSLRAGDWCIVAYVSYGGTSGQHVAIAHSRRPASAQAKED